jgi:hypothetical protein
MNFFDLISFFAVFLLRTDGQARLEFVQNIEYKFLELLSIPFHASPEDVVKQNISYRYSVLRAKEQIISNRIKDVSAIIKVKNPSLLLQIQKDGGSKAGPSARNTHNG